MIENIFTFPGTTIQGPEPRQNVIDLIEELLLEAKSGKIQTFGCVTVNSLGYIGTSFATSGAPHAHHLVAGAVYLMRRAEKDAGVS